MEGMEDPLLDLKVLVTGTDKGQHCKKNKQKRVLKHSIQGSKGYCSHHGGEFSTPSPKQDPTIYKWSMCPAGLSIQNYYAGKLLQFETKGYPTITGKPWTLNQM